VDTLAMVSGGDGAVMDSAGVAGTAGDALGAGRDAVGAGGDTSGTASGAVEADSRLPVLVVRVRRDDPEASDSVPRVRVLVIGGQRGDEPSTLEAALLVTRELAVGELVGLLDRLDVAIVPAVNPWGLLWWIPEEPSGVDPSTDHAALRSPASRGVHRFAARWEPHVVVELREIGPTVYRVQAGLPVHPNVSPDLVFLGRFYLLPYVANELTRASVSFRELVTVQPQWKRRSALVGGADSLPVGSYFAPGEPGAQHALSSFALRGSLAVFVGVGSLDGVNGLDVRVQLHYQTLKALLEVTAGQAAGVTETIDAAAGRLPNRRVRAPTDGMPAAVTPGEPDSDDSRPFSLSLRSRFEGDDARPRLTWRVWDSQARIVTQTTDRWRPAVRRLLALPVPAAWLIAPDGEAWADLVRAHGFEIERLARDVSVDALGYPVGATATVPPSAADTLPLHAAPDASSLLVRIQRRFPAGTWVVRSDQPGRRLLFTLLEPWSEDAPLGLETPDARGRATDERTTRTGLYPVYRVDADALRRVPTEALPDGNAG